MTDNLATTDDARVDDADKAGAILIDEYGMTSGRFRCTPVRPDQNDKKPRAPLVAALIARDGPLCFWCGRQMEFDGDSNRDAFATIDHYPVKKCFGGKRVLENTKLACRKCNNARP